MFLSTIILIISLVIILAGAELFTNGIEWLGRKLNLSEGAVGSILAAVGTALPETLIPIIAIVFGGGVHAEEIGVGAILGAPFMLGTLAMFVASISIFIYAAGKKRTVTVSADRNVIVRDLQFFLIVYTGALLAAFLPNHLLKLFVAVFLVAAYVIYAYFTVTKGHKMGDVEDEEDMTPLRFKRNSTDPPVIFILLQVASALGMIILGANFFVDSLEVLAVGLGISPFILSVIITPVATELPEKFNSVIWLGRGKDTLALGNITGAMVFQSSLIPAIGILLTPWALEGAQVWSAILAITSAAVIFLSFKFAKRVTSFNLLTGGIFYSVFLILVLGGFMH